MAVDSVSRELVSGCDPMSRVNPGKVPCFLIQQLSPQFDLTRVLLPLRGLLRLERTVKCHPGEYTANIGTVLSLREDASRHLKCGLKICILVVLLS